MRFIRTAGVCLLLLVSAARAQGSPPLIAHGDDWSLPAWVGPVTETGVYSETSRLRST